MTTRADSPELAAAKRLLDALKDQGFTFQRVAPGPDGPLRGVRETPEFLDEIYVVGFWEPDSCTAIRRRQSSLVVPGGLPVTTRVTGDALTSSNASHPGRFRLRCHAARLLSTNTAPEAITNPHRCATSRHNRS